MFGLLWGGGPWGVCRGRPSRMFPRFGWGGRRCIFGGEIARATVGEEGKEGQDGWSMGCWGFCGG